MVGSQYRVQQPIMGQLPTDEDFIAFSSLRWCRILFDYFVSQGQKPALVDAEDVIWKTKATTDKLCAQLGIDPEGIKDTWDPVPKEYWPDHKIAIAFTGDMMGSKGIERRGKEVSFNFCLFVPLSPPSLRLVLMLLAFAAGRMDAEYRHRDGEMEEDVW